MKKFLHNYYQEKFSTFNMGEWVPLDNFIAIPNEHIRIKPSMILRTQPLLSPTYGKVRIAIRAYAVPIRKIWTNFDQFRTGGADGDASIVAPYITAPDVTGWTKNSLPVRLGAAPGVPGNTSTALFVRAYNFVYNFYIRDKDLQAERVFSTGDGPDTTTDVTLANVCWDKDNFNSARPYPQKGDAVSIPLTGDADLVSTGLAEQLRTTGSLTNVNTSSAVLGLPGSGSAASVNRGTAGTLVQSMEADLSGVSAVNINDLRTAGAIQRFKEFMSQYVGEGTLNEFYRLFGVAPQDLRMQWPERLGGGDSVIQFSEVLQTAEGTDPVGELRGHGIGTAKSRAISYHVKEDMVILVMCSVKPRTMYMQGQDKQHDLTSRFDYFNPAIQNLGQQPILNKEVDASHAQPNAVFGYQDQNYWLRRRTSRVEGEFLDTLKFWHQGIEYDTPPSLNGDFVEAVPSDRIFAAGGAAAQLQVRIFNDVKRKNLVFPQGRPALK